VQAAIMRANEEAAKIMQARRDACVCTLALSQRARL
jgi:hypothetical protein